MIKITENDFSVIPLNSNATEDNIQQAIDQIKEQFKFESDKTQLHYMIRKLECQGSNKLIAEFMEYETSTQESLAKTPVLVYHIGNKTYTQSELIFHESLDSLIPVINKIIDMGHELSINTHGKHTNISFGESTVEFDFTGREQNLLYAIYETIVIIIEEEF